MKWLFTVMALFTFFTAYAENTAPTQVTLRLKELQAQGRREGWTFQVGDNEMMKYDISQITGLQRPENWKKDAKFLSPSRRGPLREHLDWREDAGGLTPIKNQGNCGSCWAFGTTAVMESILKIRDHVIRNLSEQQLVSCNGKGWGCNGGWSAHHVHVSPGAAYNTDFPYQASDVKCKAGLNTHEDLQDWGHVGASNRPPTDEEIKTALSDYGPVTVTLAVGSGFQAYKSGVYNRCDADTGNNGHLVSIVGYDDTDQAWILKNSWGTSWGEQGYGRYKYGCRTFAEVVTYVDYKPACEPQPVSFAGEDRTIPAGGKTRLGGMPMLGQTYEWTPATDLNNPNSATPLASPRKTTTYTLSATNACGTATSDVTITVEE